MSLMDKLREQPTTQRLSGPVCKISLIYEDDPERWLDVMAVMMARGWNTTAKMTVLAEGGMPVSKNVVYRHFHVLDNDGRNSCKHCRQILERTDLG